MTNTCTLTDTDLAWAIRTVADELGWQRFDTIAAVAAYRCAEHTPTTLGAVVAAFLGGGGAVLDLGHLIQAWNAAVVEIAALGEDRRRFVRGPAGEEV